MQGAAEALEPHRDDDLSARDGASWRIAGTTSTTSWAKPPALTAARLALARAAQIVLRNGLALLGISAPERMWTGIHHVTQDGPMQAGLMTVLVVGSVALDSVETPFGSADDVIGGSADYFASAALATSRPCSSSASSATIIPSTNSKPLAARGVDLAGLEQAQWRVLSLARALPA